MFKLRSIGILFSIIVLSTLGYLFVITSMLNARETRENLKNWTPDHLPAEDYILLQSRTNVYFVCTRSGCDRLKFPFKVAYIAQNFKNSYRVFNGWGIRVGDQIKEEVYEWNPASAIIKKRAVTVGNRKWPTYSNNAAFILKDGTVIGDFMVSGKRNMAYARQPGLPEKPLNQFLRHRGSGGYIFSPNGSYLAINAPGTMRHPTAPFTNLVRGYPHVLYKGDSLYAKAKKISSQAAYINLHYLNNYKHVSYLKLGKYKGEFKKGDWRKIIIEVLDIKTGKTKIAGEFHDELGEPTRKNLPLVINFRHHPYLIFDTKVSDYNTTRADKKFKEYLKFYDINSNTAVPLKIPDGFIILGTFNLVPILYTQATFSEHLVLGRIKNKRLELKVVAFPSQKTIFEISTDAIKLNLQYNIAYQGLKADYIMKD